MLRRCGWFILALLGSLSALSASAFSGLHITNNAELARNPSAFWSRTIVFEDEFQSIADNPIKLSRGWCYQVRGRTVTFYVPQDMAGVLQSLLPGDRIQVGAVIQNERLGLAIFTLHLEALSFTVRTSAEGPGSVTPPGGTKANRGDRLTVEIRADEHSHVDELLVDGQPAGETGPGQTAFTHTFEDIGASHVLEARFARDQYLLSVDSNRGLVTPIAGSYPFEYGREVILRIEKPEVEGAAPGERYVCRGWTGAGDVPEKGQGSEVRFTITRDSSLKWLWMTEYRLDAVAGEGGQVRGKAGWREEGAEVKLTAVPDEDYVFTGWEGDVPEDAFNANPLTVTMDRPRTVTAIFHRDTVEVEAQSGEHGRIEPSGRLPVVRGKDLSFTVTADPDYHIDRLLLDGRPVEGTFGPGVTRMIHPLKAPAESHRLEAFFAPDPRELIIRSEHEGVRPAAGTYAFPHGERMELRGVDLPLETSEPGVRFVNTGWTGSGDAPEKGAGTVCRFTLAQPSEVEWLWTQQHLLQVEAGWGGQVEGRSGWYDQDAPVSIGAEPLEDLKFAGWTGDVPPGREQDNPLVVTMDQPRTISANFEEDVFVIRATAEGSGSVDPAGDVGVSLGRSAAFSVTAAAHHHIDHLLVDGKAVGRFGQGSNAVAFTFVDVTNAHTFEAFFTADEYELRVESRHPGVAPPPGRHRVKAGMEWTAGVTEPIVEEKKPGQRLTVRGWTGTGDVPPRGEGGSVTFTVTRNSTLTWLWDREYELRVEAGEGGSVDDVAGWHPEQTPMTVRALPDKGYRFAGWQGDVTRSDAGKSTLSWILDRPRSLRAIFERDLVAVKATAGEHGSILPEGEIPVERNGDIRFSIRADPRHHIARLLIDGRKPGSFEAGSNALIHTFFNVTNYHTIAVEFEPNTFALTVESQAGGTEPAAGRHDFPEDAEVTASAVSPAAGTRPGERLVCGGWVGTGAVPESGTRASVQFRIARDSSLRWLWSREFELQASAGTGGSVKGESGWVAEHTVATLQAIPDPGYKFAGWSGSDPDADASSPTLSFAVTKPLDITALFKPDTLELNVMAGDNGRVQPEGRIEVSRGETQTVLVRADTGHHIDQILVDDLPLGSFGRDSNLYTHVFAGMDRDHQLEALFAPDLFYLEVESAQAGVEPGPGRFEYPAGTVVHASAPALVTEETSPGVRYTCAGWSGSGSVPESGTRTAVDFNLTRDSAIAWIWEPEYQLTVASSGSGGRVKGNSGWHRGDAVMVLQALPDAKNVFTSWSGDVDPGTEKENPLSVTMNRPRAVIAQFEREQGRISVAPDPTIAGWSLVESPADYVGPKEGTGALENEPAPAGAYTVRFEPLEGYEAPAGKTLNLKAGGTAVFHGAYDPIPGLQVSINRIERHVVAGQGLSNQVFQVWNAGPGELKYAISRNVSWLWIAPKVGTSAGEQHDIRVDFDTQKLTPGVYEGRITVAVRNAETLPREIPVIIRVSQEEAEAPIRPDDAGEDSNSLRRGLVAYYALNDNAHDGSVFGNHGVLHGAPAFVNHPPFGQAGVFNRRGERYLEIPHRDHLILSNSFTIQFWYKTGPQPGRIIQKLWPAQRSAQREWEISLRDDYRMVFKYTDPGHTTPFEFLCPMDCGWAQGAWNCFAYAYSAPDNTMLGYLNGTLTTNQIPKGQVTPLNTPLPLYLMYDRYKGDGGVRFDAEGSLDEFAIWNRVLSAEELERLYTDGLGK